MAGCQHERLLKGTHPSFRGGWLCEDCGQLVDLGGLDGYVVVLAAIRIKDASKVTETMHGR